MKQNYGNEKIFTTKLKKTCKGVEDGFWSWIERH